MSEEIDLDRLEKIASEATKGPWKWGMNDGSHRHVLFSGILPVICLEPNSMWGTLAADPEHIEACSPDVVLALIERIRELESAVSSAANII